MVREVSIPILCLLAVAPAIRAATPVEAAERLASEGRWEEAERAYAAALEADETLAGAWLGRGRALVELGRAKEAIPMFERAEQLGGSAAEARYQRARAHARLGEPDEALAWLGRAVDAGFVREEALRADAVLAPIRSDPAWDRILERIDRILHPCRYDPAYAAFDFLIGTWVVRDPSGRQLATSEVRKDLAACAVVETWRDAARFERRLTSAFAGRPPRWRQFAVTTRGQVRVREGGREGDTMRFEGRIAGPLGREILERWTYRPRPEGGAELLVEESRDGGTRWYRVRQALYEPATGAE